MSVVERIISGYIAPDHRANLGLLARGLLVSPLPAVFDMADFGETMEHQEESATTCGAVGCAVGLATFLVAPKLIGELFMRYSERLFGLYDVPFPLRVNPHEIFRHSAWQWCFSGLWDQVDNTPEGAAARINFLLERGLPRNFNAQLNGKVGLCYHVPSTLPVAESA